MVVGKKKSTGNGSVGRVASSNPSRHKQVIIVLISLIVLVALIGVLYPMVKEKGVTGKAIDIWKYAGNKDPEISDSCNNEAGKVVMSDSPFLCFWWDTTSIGCVKELNGHILNYKYKPTGQFDILCDADLNQWVECNADFSSEAYGEGVISISNGEVYNSRYLCLQNKVDSGFTQNGYKGYETLYVCGNFVAGSNEYSGGSPKKVGDTVGNYICAKDGWQEVPTKGGAVQLLNECSGKNAGFVFGTKLLSVDEPLMCLGKETDAIKCSAESDGYVKSDVLCSSNTWVECNTDGIQGGAGDIIVVGEGTLQNPNYLCGGGENWYACPLGSLKSKFNSKDGVDNQDSVHTSQGSFVCDGIQWTSCTDDGTFALDNKYVCDAKAWKKCVTGTTSAGEGKFVCDDKLKWNQCTTEGDVLKKFKGNFEGSWKGSIVTEYVYYCDGTSWKSCVGQDGATSSDNKYLCSTWWVECNADIKNTYSPDHTLRCDGEQWVAVAASEIKPPAGYDWGKAPVKSKPLTEGIDVIPRTKDGTKITEGAPIFCPSADYCPNTAFPGGDKDPNYCYSENTKFNKNSLCVKDDKGGLWVTCSKTNFIADNKNYLCLTNSEWQKCTEKTVKVDKFYCDGTKWNECTTDLEGTTIDDDSYQCVKGKWTSTLVVKDISLFEVKLTKGGSVRDVTGPFAVYKKINLCDKGTEFSADKTTLCYDTSKTISLESTSRLLTKLAKPFDDGPSATKTDTLTFIYDETVPKTVSAILTVNVVKDHTYLTGTFEHNFVEGRRLMAKLGGEYYLISRKVSAATFKLDQLSIRHIPTGQEFSPLALPGGKYQFTVFAEKAIILSEDKGVYTITSAKPTLAAATYAVPIDLSQTYEAEFTKDATVNLQAFGVVGICKDDPAIPSILTVCDATKEIFDLQSGKSSVEGATPFLFRYVSPLPTESKKGKIFYRLDLSEEQEQSATIFSNNLVKGKSLGLTVEDNNYLLYHPVSPLLDLTQLNLTDVSAESSPTYLAEGDQEQVVFNLPLGAQINVKLVLTPVLHYVISAAANVVNIVDLQTKFQTSVSTYAPVTLTGKDSLGKVSIHSQDIKTLKDTMRVQFPSKTGGDIELTYAVPQEVGSDFLFYYGKFTAGGKVGVQNVFTKYADIYLYKDLTADTFVHSFDDDSFILPLLKNNKIAFGLEDKYYLLTYSEPWTGQSTTGFELEKMVLTSLDGVTLYPAVKSGKLLKFNLGKNRIDAVIDTIANTITFKGVTTAAVSAEVTEAQKAAEGEATQQAKEAATVQFDPVKEYKFVLNPGQIVDVKGVKYEICDKDVFVSTITDKVNLCKDDQLFKVSTGKKSLLKINEFVNDGDLLLQYTTSIENGKTKKTVTFWNAFNLQQDNEFSWLQLTDNFKNKQFPALLWNNEWYELSGTSPALEDLELDSLNSTGNCKVKVYPGEQGEQSGMISCTSSELEDSTPNLLKIKQNLVGSDILFSIMPTDEKLVTTTPFEVSDLVTFIPSLDKPDVYTLKVGGTAALVYVQIRDKDNSQVFYLHLPKETTRIVLLPNGETIIIDVLEVSDQKSKYTPIVAVSK